ncbi:MAG: hypothetical protein KGL39_48435 [Patescibacteria group bacterium]|nr:hypothetical protein [Patescibacteria group bacterium]
MINFVSVEPKFRRQGFGSAMIEDLKTRGGEIGVAGTPEGLALARSVGAKEYEPNKFNFSQPEVEAAKNAPAQDVPPTASARSRNAAALTAAGEHATTKPDAGAETITGQNGGVAPDAAGATTLAPEQMPAERERPPKTRVHNSFFIRPRSDGTSDILDAIQELGGLKPPGKSVGGEYDGFREAMTGPARLLVRRAAKHSPDTIIHELHSTAGFQRLQTPDDLYDAIRGAVKQRDKLRVTDRAASVEAKQVTQFRQKAIDGKFPKARDGKIETISAKHLLAGDTFEVGGHKFVVEHLEFDDHNQLAYVQVQDGPKFGVQQIGADDMLHFDKNSFEAGPEHGGSMPAPQLKEEPGNPDLWNLPDDEIRSRIRQLRSEQNWTPATEKEFDDLQREWRARTAPLDTPKAPGVESQRESQTAKTEGALPDQNRAGLSVGREKSAGPAAQTPTDFASALLADADAVKTELASLEKQRQLTGGTETKRAPRNVNGNLAYADQYRQTLLQAHEAVKSADPQAALQAIVDAHNRDQAAYDQHHLHTKGKLNDPRQYGWERRLQGSADAIGQITARLDEHNERLKTPAPISAKAEQLALGLESLKTGIGKGGQLHALGIAADLWDRAVSIAQAAIRAGGTVADAIEAAIRHIKDNFKGQFDEAGARAELQNAAQEKARPERERTMAQVKADVAASESDLRAATKKVATDGGKENRNAMHLATAKYRGLRDELLHHPDYVAEQLAQQHAAVTEANEILKPLGISVRPDEAPNPAKLAGKLSPEQIQRLQDLQGTIDASHAELMRMPPKMVSRIYGEMLDDGRLPKGDGFMPDAGRSLEKVTDWLRKNGVDSPKKSLAERLNLGQRVTEALHDAKTTLQKAMITAKGLWKAAVESYKEPPRDDDFRHVIKSWIYSDQRTGLATHQFVRELVRKVPDADRRKGMAVWLDADGDADILKTQLDDVPAPYKKAWEAAMKLTDSEKQLAMQIRQDFADKLDDGQKVGILDQGRADYGVPQRWKIKPENDGDPVAGKKGSPGNPFTKLDSRSPFFSFQRETPSYFDGIMAKGVPENLDIAHLVATYDQAFHKALSSRGMIKALQDAQARDGLPVVKLSGSASIAKSPEGNVYFADSKAWNKNDVSVDGRPYQSVDHSALRGWALRMKDEKGNPIFVKGDMLIHPDHVAYLKNELANSGLRDVPLLGGVMRTQAFLKASKLSASAFHLMTIGEHMASHLVNPFLGDFKIDLRQPDQTLLVRNGLELGMGSPRQAFSEGLASGHSGLFNKIPGLGDLSAKMTDWMFRDYIPTIMMKTGLRTLEANRKRYGDKLTPDQVAELTARQMNAAGGLLNKRLDGADGNFWAQLGSNKTMMDINRMALLAPQFLEARLKVVGQALKPYGAEQRKMLILQAGILYAGCRVLNELLDDDPHWTDEPFSVVHNGRAYSIRTIVGDFYYLLSDPAGFASGRLSPLTKILTEDVLGGGRSLRTGARKDLLVQTQNPVGRLAQNVVMDLANWLTPIPVEGLLPGAKGRDESIAGMALQSVGVGSHKDTDVGRIYRLADEFNRNSPDAAARSFQASRDNTSFGHSVYSKLDDLLDAGETKKAQIEYKALLASGKTPAQIAARYDRTAPFTGNGKREIKFLASLTPEQKNVYRKARAEQQARQRAFRALAK